MVVRGGIFCLGLPAVMGFVFGFAGGMGFPEFLSPFSAVVAKNGLWWVWVCRRGYGGCGFGFAGVGVGVIVVSAANYIYEATKSTSADENGAAITNRGGLRWLESTSQKFTKLELVEWSGGGGGLRGGSRWVCEVALGGGGGFWSIPVVMGACDTVSL
uniref:Transmembrane protein n=1 Tax=Fagus sylvatica TaxID=28930 RepID=A0A2N9H966_FAGSY